MRLLWRFVAPDVFVASMLLSRGKDMPAPLFFSFAETSPSGAVVNDDMIRREWREGAWRLVQKSDAVSIA